MTTWQVRRIGGARSLVLVGVAAACANVELPPGSPPDLMPPVVVEQYPAPNSVVPDLDGDAWLRFDEPLQSPQSIERGLDLSPAWEWQFRPRRSGFSIRPREGWRTGVVYHIRVPAGIGDLLRNTTRSTIEWSFSTGPELVETRIDGTIYSRVEGTGTRDARILFLPPDSVPYSVVSDTGGVFGIRSLPPGEYSVFGFLDENRNRRLDRDREAYDSARVSLPEANSRYALDLWMVPPDSTPPMLVAASVQDTVTIVLEFDDPLEPEAPMDSVTVRVQPVAGGAPLAVREVRVGPPGVTADLPLAQVDSLAAGRDTVAVGDEPPVVGDSAEARAELPAAGDSAQVRAELEAPADSLPAEEEELEARARSGLRSAEARPIPYPTLLVSLEQPLSADTFRVAVSGVRNLRGLVGAGDTTFVFIPPPVAEAAEEGAVDAAGAPQEDPEATEDRPQPPPVEDEP